MGDGERLFDGGGLALEVVEVAQRRAALQHGRNSLAHQTASMQLLRRRLDQRAGMR
jgi:hypothetical protein